MKKIGVLEGCFGRWFTVSLQKQKSPHLIGQKSGDFPPLRLKVYILFTEFSSLYLHCRENRPFDNHISKKLHCPHPYEFSRRIRDHFLEKKKILLTYTQKIGVLRGGGRWFTVSLQRTKVSSSNRTKKWKNIPLAMKGLHFVYRNQYPSSNRTKNSRFEGCSTENL